eukprot:TRINITY_DN2646_c0_g1_i2.p1 TRINITY_DN2646_c0_g1~~TRINITY_DN2646_c0_g1_i2.p1  ORF type:complete len:124 (+),score=29.46 TRINITY_DN2646_c0_g1_i2:33-404(+)
MCIRDRSTQSTGFPTMKLLVAVFVLVVYVVHAQAAYCSLYAKDALHGNIDLFQLGTINNPSLSDKYTDYSSTVSADLDRKETHTFSIGLTNTDKFGVAVWIDFNIDEEFDNEKELMLLMDQQE